MAKYHISSDGSPKPCHAQGACPLGGDTPHGEFSTPQEAQAWAEAALEARYGGPQAVSKEQLSPAQSADPDAIYEARISRRVRGVLESDVQEHWGVIPGREVDRTFREVVKRLNAENFPRAARAFEAALKSERGEYVAKYSHAFNTVTGTRPRGTAPAPSETVDSEVLLQARIERRVEDALRGQDGHWDVVPRREVSRTLETLADRLTGGNYPQVLDSFRAAIAAGRTAEARAHIDTLQARAATFMPPSLAKFDADFLRAAARSSE